MVRLINSKSVDCFLPVVAWQRLVVNKAALCSIATDTQLGRKWQSQRDCTMQFSWLSGNSVIITSCVLKMLQ